MINPPKLNQQAMSYLSSPAAVSKPVTEKHIASIFQNDDAYGTSLFVAATRVLSVDELSSFAPETIRLELQEAAKIRHIDQDVFDRLMAAIAIVTTDRFYQDLPAFIEICNVLSGTAASPNVFDPADAYEIAWGVAEAKILDSFDAEIDGEEFSEEIRVYMGAALEDEGFFSAPSVLPMAIMTNRYDPASSFANSDDIMPAVLSADEGRHTEVQLMLTENMAALVGQLEIVAPGVTKALRQVQA